MRKSNIFRFFRKVSNCFEYCFNLEVLGFLSEENLMKVSWLLSETFEPKLFSERSFLFGNVIEVGPRLNFATAWNTNALSIFHACGIDNVTRIERSRRYILPAGVAIDDFTQRQCDRMTECVYEKPLDTFEMGIITEAVYKVPLIEEGPDALLSIPGISMDEADRNMYFEYFVRKCGRNPTIVEIMDLNNANSEHSRHGFFRGQQVIDGKRMPETLMDIVRSTLKRKENSRIAFSDNSSVIEGNEINTIIPNVPGLPSLFRKRQPIYHILFTAETHNFPSGIAPFPGAETGTGGRIRDVQATGRGGLVVAGTAAYCVGNLLIPGYELPWENHSFVYPKTLASPLDILIQASNGASDYGNKFGEPVIQGFVRSLGLKLSDGVRREWLKPIMFTGGVGQVEEVHLEKENPQKDMHIVQIGGPAYRIGFGGGAASSLLQGENREELDFNAVQRGDAEMGQKVNRVVRACVERWMRNPIASIHDQGAGGPANVLKELVEKSGGQICLNRINLGDPTLSIVEIWVCEYQERNGLLIYSDRLKQFKEICERENVPCEVLGKVTGDGIFTAYFTEGGSPMKLEKVVELHLDEVLGNIPQKTYSDSHVDPQLIPLEMPDNLTVREALERVLRNPAVGSKRFLTNKVDRSVTGLIARQQCIGPLQLPLADVAVVSQSHFSNDKGKYTGAATAIGERPLIGLVDPAAQGRMTVAEMLTNICFAKISNLKDIKCSGNWMWAPKLSGEGAKLYDAAIAMRDIMLELGIAIDGGKDSLSMATKVKLPDGNEEIVKSPGQLVLSGYVTVPDVTKVVTPDFKSPGSSRIIFIDLANGKKRLGGSVLAQCYKQIGDECPDLENPDLLKRAFYAIQELIDKDLILAGHDISDGGLIVALLEMAFAGNCGFTIATRLSASDLFAEEVGLLIEFGWDMDKALDILKKHEVPFNYLGLTTSDKTILIEDVKENIFEAYMPDLRQIWESTSYRLELLQCDPECVEEERRNIYDRIGPKYHISFDPCRMYPNWLACDVKPVVAIIREEGSNGDREMTSAFYKAGFECYDITMSDLRDGRVTLDLFRGISFVGGFSYADVMDSAKGWAASIRFNERVRYQFEEFYDRSDTFSLGVCNGCQLMALLGRVPLKSTDMMQPRFIHNKSGRFESRWSTVEIISDRPMMFRDMVGSRLGIWVAHGEGRFFAPDKEIETIIRLEELAPIRYVDDNGEITESYPFNPNGSPNGIAGLCSPDGRHLAMMPHPERVIINWQWGYLPQGWNPKNPSPWMRMFLNAKNWCDENQ